MSEFDEAAYSDLSDEFEGGNSDGAENFEREDAFLLANLNSLSVEPAAPAVVVEMSLVDVGYSRDITKINVPMPDKLLFTVPSKSKSGKGKPSTESQAPKSLKEKKQRKKKKKLGEEKGTAGQAQPFEAAAQACPPKYGSVTLAKRQPGAPASSAKQTGESAARRDAPRETAPQPRHPPRLLQRNSDSSAQHREYLYRPQQEAAVRGGWQSMSDRSSEGAAAPANTELRACAPEFNPSRPPPPPHPTSPRAS